MGYDPEFFIKYAAYLKEPTVRRSHDRAFATFAAMTGANRLAIIDLGCGSGEYFRHGRFRSYLGIDRANNADLPAANFRELDYTSETLTERLCFYPVAAVSLFSIEACYPAAERYALYEHLYRSLRSLMWMMTAGFYYRSKADQETVGEAGGIVSYQTIEPLHAFESPLFEESRLIMETPSLFFGPDVVEVYKLLCRRR